MTDVTQQPFAIDASSQFPTSNRAPRTAEAFAMLLDALTNGGGRSKTSNDLINRYNYLDPVANGPDFRKSARPKIEAAMNEEDKGFMTSSILSALLGTKNTAPTIDGRIEYKEMYDLQPNIYSNDLSNKIYFADPANEK